MSQFSTPKKTSPGAKLVLFGKPILTEQQMCEEEAESSGHCKVFMESEDVGRTLDLSRLRSYQDLYRKLAEIFGIDNSESLTNALYRDGSGPAKHIGDQPFSDFTKTARRLTILMDSSGNGAGDAATE